MRSFLVAAAVYLVAFPASGDDVKPLLEAARAGDLDRVKSLISMGMDVNATDQFGITALWQATSKKHEAVVRALIEAGADVNRADDVWHVSPLMVVDDPDLLKLLVERGATGIAAKLNQAALRGQADVIKAILETGKVNPALLARAKAHADLAKREEIATLLAEGTDEALPEPPKISDAVLGQYVGKYLDDRLNETAVEVSDGKLYLKYEYAGRRQLLAIDERTFEFGSSRYTFELVDGRVKQLVQNDPFSERRYQPVDVTQKPNIIKETLTTEAEDPSVVAKDNWPNFRGPGARGIAAEQRLPDTWDVPTDVGVQWKTTVPGLGNSCPIVWGNRVFITTAVSAAGKDDIRIGLYGSVDAVDDESEHSWRVYCLDKETGQILWQRVAETRVPPVKRHLKSTQANSTPATDGKHVVAMFSSGGLFCYDVEGELVWNRDLGTLDAGAFNDPDYQWGYGSSPYIYRNMVLVQCDLQEGSFLAAFDLASGDEIWRADRDEVPSWGTPTVFDTPQGPRVLTNGTNFARGYDALSGKEVWKIGGNSAITVPTPFVARDLIFVTSGYRPIQPIYAIRLDAEGDLTLEGADTSSEFVAWSTRRGGPYLPTPIAYGAYLYTCSNNGILSCYEARSGERIYRERVGSGSFTASPVAADGIIYLTTEEGRVFAVHAGPEYALRSEHSLGNVCLATPAIAGGLFIARTKDEVVAIGQ